MGRKQIKLMELIDLSSRADIGDFPYDCLNVQHPESNGAGDPPGVMGYSRGCGRSDGGL